MTGIAEESEALLSLTGVSKRFANTQALDDVSIAFRPGRVHALVGENGAGKSTLVKIVSGIVQPDSGHMRLDGEEVAFATPAAASSAGIHLVHQELALLPWNSVVENIFLGHERRAGGAGLSWSRMAQTARAALAQLGMEIDVHRPVGELSTAQQQMVEIARATFRDSRLIVLDEPTAALAPADTARLFTVLRQIAEKGTAIVYISHRLDEVAALADDVTVLKDGRKVTTEPAAGLDAGRMIRLMVGRVIEDLYPERASVRDPAPLLEVEGLVDPPAVSDVAFTVGNGEIVGLYGLEGHGQDEVLSCIAGARAPVRGRVAIDGRERPWASIPGMIAMGVGLVPEDRKTEGLILNMTAGRNITLPIVHALSRAGLVSAAKEAADARDAADAARVRGDLKAPARSLSGGNQQKLLLARWIAAETSILLLNQPTRGVDVGSKSEIYRLIRETYARPGRAALVVSREIMELQGLCDRILVMSHGRLIAEHGPDAAEETILASAVGRQHEATAQ